MNPVKGDFSFDSLLGTVEDRPSTELATPDASSPELTEPDLSDFLTWWRALIGRYRLLYHVRPVPGHVCEPYYQPLSDVVHDKIAWELEQSQVLLRFDEEQQMNVREDRGILHFSIGSTTVYACTSCGRTHVCNGNEGSDPCTCRFGDEGYPVCVFSGRRDDRLQQPMYDWADGYDDAQHKLKDLSKGGGSGYATMVSQFRSIKSDEGYAHYISKIYSNERIRRDHFNQLQGARRLLSMAYDLAAKGYDKTDETVGNDDDTATQFALAPVWDANLPIGAPSGTHQVATRDLDHGIQHPGFIARYLLAVESVKCRAAFGATPTAIPIAHDEEVEEVEEEEEEEEGEEEAPDPRSRRYVFRERPLVWMRQGEHQWKTARYSDEEWLAETKPDVEWIRNLADHVMALDRWLTNNTPHLVSMEGAQRRDTHIDRLCRWVWLHTIRRPRSIPDPLRILGAYMTYVAVHPLSIADGSGHQWPVFDNDLPCQALVKEGLMPWIFLSDLALQQRIKEKRQGEETLTRFLSNGPFRHWSRERGTLIQLRSWSHSLHDAIHGPTPRGGKGKPRQEAEGHAPWFFAWFHGTERQCWPLKDSDRARKAARSSDAMAVAQEERRVARLRGLVV